MMNTNSLCTGPSHHGKCDGSDSAQGLPELCVVPLPPLHVPLCALLLLPPARSSSAFTVLFACRLLFEVSLCHVLPHRSISVELSLPAPQSVSPL